MWIGVLEALRLKTGAFGELIQRLIMLIMLHPELLEFHLLNPFLLSTAP